MTTTYIEIGGKQWPVHFGLRAFNMIEKLTGKPFTRIGEVLNNLGTETMVQLLYAGMYGGALREKQDFSLNIEQIWDWLDEEDIMKSMQIVVDAITAALPVADGGEPGEAKEKK